MATDFVQWLIYEMNAKGYSQSELSRRAGVSTTAISNVLAENRSPGPEFCIGIAKALKLPPEHVFRKAGLLPPESTMKDPSELYIDPDIEDFREILRQLTPEEAEELKRIGWLKIDLKRQAELRKKGKG